MAKQWDRMARKRDILLDQHDREADFPVDDDEDRFDFLDDRRLNAFVRFIQQDDPGVSGQRARRDRGLLLLSAGKRARRRDRD